MSKIEVSFVLYLGCVCRSCTLQVSISHSVPDGNTNIKINRKLNTQVNSSERKTMGLWQLII